MKYVFLQTIFGFHHYISQVLPNPNNMPTASSKISQQEVLEYDWLPAETLPDNTTCDIENCCTPKTTLTPKSAWSTIVQGVGEPAVTAYAGTNCIEKAILTQATAKPNPDAPVTVASMGRTTRGVELACRFRMRTASSAGAPTAAPTGSISEQDSTDKPSKDRM
jgi:hypothetical protein